MDDVGKRAHDRPTLRGERNRQRDLRGNGKEPRETKPRTGGLPPSASGLSLKLSYYALLPLLFLRTLRFCFLPGGPPEPPASV
jgi:hypothetical protein